MTQTPFSSLNLSPELQRAINEMGFENATEIQAKTIPLIIDGNDIIGRSQTGTGKTAAFAVPAVEMTDGANKKDVQALVVCPTRELAIQSWEVFKLLYKYKTGVKAAVVYGGQQIDRQIRELKRGVNIVIGTPGRIMDHMRRKTLKLDNLKMIILDEADEMLNMGFREDIETILEKTPSTRQTIFFSATMPPEIMAITKRYQNSPKVIEVNKSQMTLSAINHYFSEVPSVKKPDALIELLKMNNLHKSIVFCNTQKMVDNLCRFLIKNKFQAVALHGGMKQNVRTVVMQNFKNCNSGLLIATDVAARGIDAHDVDAVINFDIPPNNEYYIHRIGRTGRAGKSGNAYTLVSGRSQSLQLRDIERAVKIKIIYQDIEIAGHTFNLNSFENPQEKGFNRERRPRKMSNGAAIRPRSAHNGDTSKIVINLGKKQYIAPNHIVKAIAEKTSLSGTDIGKIEIFDKSTVVEIPSSHTQEVMDAMKGSKIKRLFVNVKPYDQNTQMSSVKPVRRDNRNRRKKRQG